MHVKLFLGSHAPLSGGRNSKLYPAHFNKPLIEKLLRDYFDVDNYGSSLIFHEYPLSDFGNLSNLDPNTLIIRSMSVDDASHLLYLDEDLVKRWGINNSILYEPVTINSLMAWNASLIATIESDTSRNKLDQAQDRGVFLDEYLDLFDDLVIKQATHEILLAVSSVLRDAVMVRAIDALFKRGLADNVLVIRGFAHRISLERFLDHLGFDVEFEYDSENINYFNEEDFRFMSGIVDRISLDRWPLSALDLIRIISDDPYYFSYELNHSGLFMPISTDNFRSLLDQLYKEIRDMEDEYDNPFLATAPMLEKNLFL